MYEMLVGYPPFYSDDPMSTCRKVSLGAVQFNVCNLLCPSFSFIFMCLSQALSKNVSVFSIILGINYPLTYACVCKYSMIL